MPRELQEVPDAELNVLQQLWEHGPATIQQLTEALYPRTTDAYYATVQKLLERLEGKGCVRRDRSARAHVLAAAVNRDEIIGRRLEVLDEKLSGGAMPPLITILDISRILTSM